MNFLGIDPGAQGACALLDGEGKLIDCDHFEPLAGDFDMNHFNEVLLEWRTKYGIDYCLIEHAQAMPGQGVSSMFKYGKNFGSIVAMTFCNRIPYELVRPVEWTREMHKGLTGDRAKQKSLAKIQQLFPEEDFRVSKKAIKPHEGIVDAVLIAEYARRYYARN